MPATSKGFRYPQGTDNTNLAQYYQNLATDVDGYLNGIQATIGYATGWSTLAGGYPALQAFKLANLCVVYGVIANTNAYSAAQTPVSSSLPAAYRPSKGVMVHGGVQIGVTAALQSCRFDVNPGGTITVSPNTTIAANSFHTFTAVYPLVLL